MVAFIAATYFHFQVGGFWFLAALLYMVTAGQFSRETIAGVAAYAAGILPLLLIVIGDRRHGIAVPDSNIVC